MDNKSYLRHGIFVDYEYTTDIEQKQRLLLPILKRARQTEPYKGHCKMEEDRLVICGRTYTLENLQQLPDDLNCFNVTSKEDNQCLGFFGGLNPKSNFHNAPFQVDGIEYFSSEQYIQAKKVEYFNDRATYDRIMGSSTSLDCKKNSRFIKGFDRSKWEEVAKQICSPGIKAKFHQNSDLTCTLLNKTGFKRIVECTNDKLWGTGIPLNRDECLDQSKWTNQGILGEILEEIRHEFRSTKFSVPPPGTGNRHQLSITNGSSSELPHQLPSTNPTKFTFPPLCEGTILSQMNSAMPHTSVMGPLPFHHPQFTAVTRSITHQTITTPHCTTYSAHAEIDNTTLEVAAIARSNQTGCESGPKHHDTDINPQNVEPTPVDLTESTAHNEVEMTEPIPS